MKTSIIAILTVSVILASAGKGNSIEKPFSDARSDFKPDAYHHFVQGLLFEQEGRYEEALQEYRDTVAIDPEAGYVHKSLSALNIKIGRLDAALKAAQRLQQIEKNNPDFGKHLVLYSTHLLDYDMESIYWFLVDKSFDILLKLA